MALLASLPLMGCGDTYLALSPRPAVHPHRGRTFTAIRRRIPARSIDAEPVTSEILDEEAKRLFQAELTGPAIPLVPDGNPPRVTAMALRTTAQGEAPHMRPIGPLLSAHLNEGQRAAVQVTLPPGECATFIAQGGIGVVEVDLFLTAPVNSVTTIVAQDPGTGPIAVIGGHGRCFRNASAEVQQATLHATVRRGRGVILVRDYRGF